MVRGNKEKKENHPLKPPDFEFVSKELAPDLKSLQTIPLILQNSILQLKGRNLKK